MEKIDNRKFNGGARPNAGRRKTAKTLYSQKEMREMLHTIIQENNCLDFKQIVNSLVQKAKVDPKVASYVIDQIVGKPSQSFSDFNGNEAAADIRIVVRE